MGWEMAHECLPEYHCCVHDDCWPGDADECVLFTMTKKDAEEYRAKLEAEAETNDDDDEDG